jgi:Rad3-related DNA helicase
MSFSRCQSVLSVFPMCRRQARGAADASKKGEQWQLQFSLWCMNPACIFRSISKEARSIIVTSGTLSPMFSFQSELGMPFAHQLEAPHVVPKKQVCLLK